MATDRSASRYQGLLIPDSRITVANITDQGTGNTDSAFGQGGPRPGVPKPSGDTDLILQASGSQEAGQNLEIYTQRAGHAGRDGAGFLWRDVAAGDSASQYQGFDPHSVLTGWESLVADKTNTNDAHPAIIRLANGKLLATGTQAPDSSGQFQLFYIYDPASGAWTKKTRTLASTIEQTGAALVELPSGRVLWIGRASDTAQVEVRYSDDEFSTWAIASSRALKTACGGAILKAVAAYSAGEVGLWLLWEDGSGTQTLSQYASDDLGLRFSRVVNDWNAEAAVATPAGPAVIAAAGGGFLLGYVHTASGQGLHVWHVSSAFVAPVSGESVIVDSTGSTNPLGDDAPMALWRDESGAVFVMGYAGTPGGEAALFASHDDGRTWAEYNAAQGFDVFNSGGDPVFRRYAVASTSGRAIMLTRWTSGLSFGPGSLGVLHLGGYGRHTAPISDAGTEFTDADGIGFSPQSGGSGDGFMYVPIELPGSAGWTKTGSGAESEEAEARSGSLPASAIALKTDATSAVINYERTITATQQVFAQFACSLSSGAGNQGADDVAVKVRITGGPGTSYEVRYRFSDTGWTIVDPSGPTEKGSVTEATTTAKGLILHRVAISVPESGTVKFQTWWCRFGHTLDWVAGPNGTLANQTTPADSGIEFGHFNGTQPDVVYWHHMAISGWGDRWSPSSYLGIGDSSDWSNPGSLHPRNVPPLALPALIDGSTKIAAVDGPTVEGEKWNVVTEYDSPIDHAVEVHSPRVAWQSVDESEQLIVWDLHNLGGATASKMLNSSIGCALLGCNFRQAKLQFWNGSAWADWISFDAAQGFSSIKYTLTGNVATVDVVASDTADRYLNYDDLRGATFKEAGGKSKKIKTQTEGAWTATTTKRPRLLIDDVDGSLAAAGVCELWFSDMCGVAHEVTGTPRYIRLNIPASQGTVAGRYEIGQIALGSLLIFGHQPSRGFTNSTQQGTAITDLADGSTRATRTGPPRRSLELSWDDGIDASQTQAASAVPDYVAGTSGGLPVATRSDIARTLEGALREAASADVPVVYIGRIPTNSATPDTLNNPRQFLYGRASGEYRREHILGDEAASEVDRIAKITITEVV